MSSLHPGQDPPPPASTYVLSCDALVDDEVVNARGQDLGRIAHIVLDVSQGKVAYAVVAHGGVFGIGEKLFAVPWSALVLDAERRCFVLDIPKERLDDWEGIARLQ
jgi:sporulation protein YlmC with PRC-barrel domain